MANDVVAVRSIEIVTAEIHTIRDNVARVFMDGVVQIGRRLEEAKQLVPQGEWLQYLDKELGYKPSTAQNYMRIAREFGDGQVGLSGKTPGDFFGNLGYSQLLPLLGLPEEEREQLAEQHDLAGMSSREIQALVRERDEAKANADKLQKDVGHLKDKLEDADKDISDYPMGCKSLLGPSLRSSGSISNLCRMEYTRYRSCLPMVRWDMRYMKNPVRHIPGRTILHRMYGAWECRIPAENRLRTCMYKPE